MVVAIEGENKEFVFFPFKKGRKENEVLLGSTYEGALRREDIL